MISLFNFEEIQFPGYFDLKEAYDKGQSGRLLLFNLGSLGVGFFSCFINNNQEISFVSNIGDKRHEPFKFNIVEESRQDYYNFCQSIIDYCLNVFCIEMDCSNTWKGALT